MEGMLAVGSGGGDIEGRYRESSGRDIVLSVYGGLNCFNLPHLSDRQVGTE
jgi:hypothetical protein